MPMMGDDGREGTDNNAIIVNAGISYIDFEYRLQELNLRNALENNRT